MLLLYLIFTCDNYTGNNQECDIDCSVLWSQRLHPVQSIYGINWTIKLYLLPVLTKRNQPFGKGCFWYYKSFANSWCSINMPLSV